MEDSNNSANPLGRRILVLFAHPATQKSRVNRVLAARVRELEGVTFHDLYDSYPEFDIDVKREQELVLSHDVVVFQHPFFWYSTPAILKEWQDLVLEHGWAYGRDGTALHGKLFVCVVTAGGGRAAYESKGYNGRTVREFLAPIEGTARLCGMTYLAPFVAHGTHAMKPEHMEKHANDYWELLVALRDDRIDIEAATARDLPFLNSSFDRLIRTED